MADKLKNCPCCGSSNLRGYDIISCLNCSCLANNKDWNTRPPLKLDREKVAKLIKETIEEYEKDSQLHEILENKSLKQSLFFEITDKLIAHLPELVEKGE